jgi:hypothetical protein
MENLSRDYSRRKFLGQAGKGILATSLITQLPFAAEGQQTSNATFQSRNHPIDVQLKPLDDPTERQESPLPSVIRPDERIGYCIVGLGHLALGQILPAFGKCKYARPTALVSGDADKAAKVAAQYGIPAKSIYNYKNFDEIKNNKDIDVVYVVLPNSSMPNIPFVRHKQVSMYFAKNLCQYRRQRRSE